MTNDELRITNEKPPHASIANRQSSIIATAFNPFGTQHLAALAVITALCALVAWLARSANSQRRQWLRRLLGCALLGYTACVYIQQGIAYGLAWDYSLPLELCNLVLIACLISLFWPNQFTSEIAYFWGLGGVLQATLTPDLGRAFPSWDFMLFFWGHGATLMAIIFLIVSRELRPRKRSILRMMAAINIYAILVGTIDAITGWNYGYLCSKPAMPSLLDFLGPWPWYLLSLEAIAFLTFLILNLLLRLVVCIDDPAKAPAVEFRK
jgi:hypothetical integral membrane protein (TIGR02206 family)